MKFKIEKLGHIDKGELEPGELTVLCGPNNSGKTYLSYSLFGFLQHFDKHCDFEIPGEIFENLLEKGFYQINLENYENKALKVLRKASDSFVRRLPEIFDTNEDFFSGLKFEPVIEDFQVDYAEEKQIELRLSGGGKPILRMIKPADEKNLLLSITGENRPSALFFEPFLNSGLAKIFFGKYFKHPFVITSERTGISLFHKELDINKNVLIELLKKLDKSDTINPFDFFSGVLSRYPASIKGNIDLIRDFDIIAKRKSFLMKKEAPVVRDLLKKWEAVTSGKFKMLNNELLYIPKKERKRDKVAPLPINMASSAVKSLVLLDMYIKHMASENDILLIDKPELNLHPNNQVMMARFLARLVNMGINVFVTTHSDYILKEFNHVLMLSNDFPEKEEFMKKHKYSSEEVLDKSRVKA